jgi:formamidopyrimidine-DNA glycosylase
MPELPEVEAARRAIEEHCIGKKIKKAIIADDSKVIDGVSPSDFVAALVGKTIVSALRKGKNLWLQLDSPPFPSFQFGNILCSFYWVSDFMHFKADFLRAFVT